MSPDLSPLVFIAAILVLATGLLRGLYVLIRDEPTPDKKTPKKIMVSNVR
jgi:hypothetical protein